MSSVKVAVRVRPMNRREHELDSRFIIQMEGKKTIITNVKMTESVMGNSSRESTKDFTYDYSYWSLSAQDSIYHSQEQVFQDLGTDVISSAYEGYNACVFAYGQTGSGKTYTMMGNPADAGLIPRICQELYGRMTDVNMTYRTEVSYLEIYNEKVRDLLVGGSGPNRAQHSLRVREHPKYGPYVQDLSKHIVVNYTDILELMYKGNVNRTTAATGMNDVSSRSHAIFTMTFTQAKFSQDAPSEKHSKIHLVDLAGSERADATGATGQRLKEGGSINKSLVTLGKIISTLADMSERGKSRKSVFIPYRDSVLTWLLRDSLGGNAKTIMVATISPAECNYAETLSTLRYANRAKNIINKPTVNEDANVRLIRELRGEISRLKTLLGGKSDELVTPKVQEKLHENEARIKVLTEEWTDKWREMAHILKEEKTLALRKEGLGVVLDSELPHLIGIDDDILSTGIMLYHLKEGKTNIGTVTQLHRPDIVLQGEGVTEEHCAIEHQEGQVTLIPAEGSLCTVNGTSVTDPVILSQGAVILLGKTNMFRFNHPAQAAKLREELKGSSFNLTRNASLSQSMTDLARSTENLALFTSGWEMEQRHQEQLEALEMKRQQIEEMEENHRASEAARIRDLEVQEKHLSTKRTEIEKLTQLSSQMKQEAEQMKLQMVKEAEVLKRRSLDVERQYALFMKKRNEYEEQALESSDEDVNRLDKEGLKKRIRVERHKLEEHERVAQERARMGTDKINKEKGHLVKEHEERRARMEEEIERLGEEIKKRNTCVEKMESDLVDQWRDLQSKREKEQDAMQRQVRVLEEVRSDHDAFHQFLNEIDESTRSRLQLDHDKMTEMSTAVKQLERQHYQDYQKDLEAIKSKKTSAEQEVEERMKQLDADKVYLSECVSRVEQALERKNSLSEEELEQIERESIAIETEREIIKEDEEKLNTQRFNIQRDFEEENDALQYKRDEQVEAVNKEKEKLKQFDAERAEKVVEETKRTKLALEHLCALLDDKEKGLEEQELILKTMKEETETEVQALSRQKEEFSSELEILEVKCRSVRHDLNKKRAELEEAAKEDMKQMEGRRKLLDELEERQVKATESELELEDQKAQLEHYMKLKEGSLLQQERYLEEIRLEDELNIKKEKESVSDTQCKFAMKIQELSHLEEQLRLSEAELEEKQQYLELQRQEELDRIELEKFQLQEMENQERINALVEQEVKRRLFEERVQREKQRRMERENERLEREKELTKIKRAHDREIQRLKEKYESNPAMNMYGPTKANPYANIMTAEHTSINRSRSSEHRLSSNALSVVPLVDNVIEVSIPGYVQRGSTLDTHYEFEVKITAGADTWSVYRRYSRFRELHQDLKTKYPQINALVFPPKRWLSNRSEKVVAERRKLLEDYLRSSIQVLQRNPGCRLHPSRQKLYSKQVIYDFHPFFKKGLFETSKHGTC